MMEKYTTEVERIWNTNNSAKLFSFLLCGKNSFISFNSQLPEKLKTFIEGKVDNMHEVFNSAVDALAQLGSTSHSAEFVDLVSTVDELVRKCIQNFDAHIVLSVYTSARDEWHNQRFCMSVCLPEFPFM